jgi:hypothetical protein
MFKKLRMILSQNQSCFIICRGLFFAISILISQISWAQSECNLYLSKSASQSAVANYRLDQKKYTFPDLNSMALNSIIYTKEIKGLREKDQCSQGCSFNAVASYLEAFLSFLETGKSDSDLNLEISANYMHAIFMFWQFRWALLDLDRKVMIGGSIEWGLIEFLNKGFLLEDSYKSLNTVDVDLIRNRLNHRLSQLRASDPHGEKINLEQESVFAFKILREGFGTSPLGQPFFDGMKLFREKSVNVINYGQKALMAESVSIGGDDLYVELESLPLRELAESTIIKYVDMGLPLLLSYRHASSFLDPKTGIFLNDTTFEPQDGHAALIIGYRLDKDGKIDMVKIQNSHGNAQYFHMEIESMHALAHSIIYLTPLK